MKADTVDLAAIFGQPVRYLVPLFQRPYVWDEPNQWAPLWEDIQSVLERQLDDTPANDAIPHFMGAVVLDQVLTPIGMVQARYVIDGQQRLTTLQLFLAAARDLAEETGHAGPAAMLGKLLFNDEFLVKSPEDRFKVLPSTFDRAAFQAAVSNRKAGASETNGHRMLRGYDFFAERVREWALVPDGGGEAERRFEVLSTVLWKLLAVVAIDLDARDNAQVIFETLNARGTPLLASDLIKNQLFQVAAGRGADVDDLYDREWLALDSDWWRATVQAGRLKRPRLDIYANHWLAMKLGREVVSHLLFPDFKRYLSTRLDEVVDVIKDFRRYADVWESFEREPADSSMGLFLYRINTIEVSTAYPALLWICGPDGIHDLDERMRSLHAIESWLCRRVVVRANTQGYTQVFLGLLNRLRQSATPSAADVVGYLASLEGERGYWPVDDQVRNALGSLPIYAVLIRARLRMILEAVEDDMRTGFTEQSAPRGLTIEHVLPQEWRVHWPLPHNGDPEEAAKLRDVAKHRIGNLTLVTSKLNPKMSNAPWTEKRDYLNQLSVLLISSDIKASDAWDESTIAKRGEWIAERILRIWPDAASPRWRAF